MENPSKLGFRMPAEWEPHERTWMGWPQRCDNWRDGAGPAQAAFVDVATAISQFEPVTVCANPDQLANARKMLPAHIDVLEIPHDDAWFRDIAPTFIIKQASSLNNTEPPTSTSEENESAAAVAGIDWEFNAWGGASGGLYPTWDKDNAVAAAILDYTNKPRFKCPMVLEGGSIHVDGQGTLLTTEECLLNPNRNPDMTKEQIENCLKDYLGVTKILWLPEGLYGDDDTNGHIDNFACFARPGVVLLAWPDDESDPQYRISAEALRILESETDAKGRKLKVIKVPLPPPLHYTENECNGVMCADGTKARVAGVRLAASYVNFYICNGGVVMPAFGEVEADEKARKVIEEAFPERRVVQISSCRSIVLGGGCIHCITQQQVQGC